jgi:hypothetical protein
VEILQLDLNRPGEWAFENVMIINETNCKDVCFTKARVKEQLTHSLRAIALPEAKSCKYLRIYCDLSWAYQVNYTMKKLKTIHFTMHFLKQGNSNTKGLAYTSK